MEAAGASRRRRGSPLPPPLLGSEHVYLLAGALGSELQRLSELFGSAAVAGLVPQVIRLLELLEALVVGEQQQQQQQQQQEEAAAAAAPADGSGPKKGAAVAAAFQELEWKLSEAEKRERLLQSHLAQVEKEHGQLLAQLAASLPHEDSSSRKEKELMLRLKEVVDKQRDEIRAQAHEILCKTRDTEALEEQLHRFTSMNEELRRKLAIVQAQLRSALEKKEELENRVLDTRRDADQLSKAVLATEHSRSDLEESTASSEGSPSRGWSYFSKEELQQILQERNELKTSLFLVQEELAYYQRELLNDKRIPSLLLDAMKSAIKKQRKKIRAKMLGTVEEPVSSDEEEESAWLTAPSSDCVDSHLPGSRIKSFFGLWYCNKNTSSKVAPSGAWEIIDPQEATPEQDERTTEADRKASSSPSSPS